MILISPFAKRGYISHDYTDHVSILKFIERNWNLQPLSNRSLDRLPDPNAKRSDPYVPTNSPAIGDLFDLFDFSHPQDDQGNQDNIQRQLASTAVSARPRGAAGVPAHFPPLAR